MIQSYVMYDGKQDVLTVVREDMGGEMILFRGCLPKQLALSCSTHPLPLPPISSFLQVNGILGGLVGVTAGCAVVNIWEALFIGHTLTLTLYRPHSHSHSL